jgi:hypothetical protein
MMVTPIAVTVMAMTPAITAVRPSIAPTTIVTAMAPMTMTPVAATIVGLFDERRAALRKCPDRAGRVAANGCGSSAGCGKAETKRERHCQKKITH